MNFVEGWLSDVIGGCWLLLNKKSSGDEIANVNYSAPGSYPNSLR